MQLRHNHWYRDRQGNPVRVAFTHPATHSPFSRIDNPDDPLRYTANGMYHEGDVGRVSPLDLVEDLNCNAETAPISPAACSNCHKTPALSSDCQPITIKEKTYYSIVCSCRRMRGPVGMNEEEAVLKWNAYQAQQQAAGDDHPYSVVDPSGKVYSQHLTDDKANDSIRDLRQQFPGVPLKITTEIGWLK